METTTEHKQKKRLSQQQQGQHKHHCCICRNGFSCGQALTEEEHLANCLVMFSAARDPPEESFTSTSKEVGDDKIPPPPPPPPATPPPPRKLFECCLCKRVFKSHQALGGHRASHKRVKGCFAAIGFVNKSPADEKAPIEDENNQKESSSENMALSAVPLAEYSLQPLPKTKSKVHECSICKRQFASGQALGGHKRCHWITSNSGASSSTPAAVATKLRAVSGRSEVNVMQPQTLIFQQMFNSLDRPLDLNMPTQPMDDLAGILIRLDVPGAIYHNGATTSNSDKENLDDEVDSKEVKAANLSDLKDMNAGEERSTWLQVGIGSKTINYSRD